jgi:1,4-dihydroxy-2-naphthoate octaprenyltransferase
MDFQDTLSDRMFGQKTSVIVLGWKLAEKALLALLILWSLGIFGAWLWLPGSGVLWWLWLSGPVFNAFLFWRVIKRPSYGSFIQGFLVDSQFLLCAIGVLVWKTI